MKLAEPLDVLHTKEAIQVRVRELGAQITRDYQSQGNQGQSKDLVLVTESPLNSAKTVLGLIGQVLGLARQL